MDLKLIKQKLNALTEKPKNAKKEKVDFSKVIWKPKEGKQVIRIVPSVLNKNNPFREVYLHYGFQKFPIFALTNWGEKDPIVEFISKLRETPQKENWVLANKIQPKMRVFVPVIVRGEEELGTRLWEIGKLVYQYFLQITEDEDFGGDFTDIVNGRDFTVTGTKEIVNNKETIKCTVTAKPKNSPILEGNYTQEELDNILNNQPDILKINFKHSFDSLKTILEKWLDPSHEDGKNETKSSEENSQEEEDDLAILDTKPSRASTKDKAISKKSSKLDKFDQLFGEEK